MQPSEEIKQRINIVDLVGEYVQLKKAGVNFRAPCPFHSEKTPSFIVSPSKQIWHCFGCGLGGDVFEFVKQIEGVEFREALEILASRAGVTLKRPTVEYRAEQDQKKTLYAINDLAAKYYAKVLEASSAAAAAREYLQKRGLLPETIKKWQLGYAPDDFHQFENFVITRGFQKQEAAAAGLLVKKDDGSFYDRFRARIMFPIFDIHGRVVGFTGRIMQEQEGVAKYVNSPETPIYSKSHVLYGLNFAKTEIRKADTVIVVEGNVDVITCHEFGSSNVVGSSGTALTASQLETLKRFTQNISFAFDVDEAGLTAARRAVELALSGGFNVKLISIPKEIAKDPDELIRKDPALWRARIAEAQNFLDFYFLHIFAKLDLTASIGKKQAVGHLLPLLSLLPDPIDRAHYVRQLSGAAGVDEKLVFELLGKQGAAKKPEAKSADQRSGIAKKPKRQIMEERALGLILKFSETGTEGLTADDFSTPPLRDIFTEAQNGNIDPKHSQAVDLLIFAVENELLSMPDANALALKKEFSLQLKELILKEEMQRLAGAIKQAEVAGQSEVVRTLSGEFNNLTKTLQKYHG